MCYSLEESDRIYFFPMIVTKMAALSSIRTFVSIITARSDCLLYPNIAFICIFVITITPLPHLSFHRFHAGLCTYAVSIRDFRKIAMWGSPGVSLYFRIYFYVTGEDLLRHETNRGA